jgi:hypothetical protein
MPLFGAGNELDSLIVLQPEIEAAVYVYFMIVVAGTLDIIGLRTLQHYIFNRFVSEIMSVIRADGDNNSPGAVSAGNRIRAFKCFLVCSRDDQLFLAAEKGTEKDGNNNKADYRPDTGS